MKDQNKINENIIIENNVNNDTVDITKDVSILCILLIYYMQIRYIFITLRPLDVYDYMYIKKVI